MIIAIGEGSIVLSVADGIFVIKGYHEDSHHQLSALDSLGWQEGYWILQGLLGGTRAPPSLGADTLGVAPVVVTIKDKTDP